MEVIQTLFLSLSWSQHREANLVSSAVKGPVTRTHISGKVVRAGQCWCRWENLGKRSW